MGIREYISNSNGFISTTAAKNSGIYFKLLRSVEKGELVRVRRGVYALNDDLAKQMIDVECLVPGGVLCLYSAWFHHELTTQIPLSHFIAVERGRKITLPDFPPIELSHITKDIYYLGIEEAEIDGFKVKVYNLEKSVCDAIKYRNKIGIDVASEILKNYLNRKDRNITRLYEYAEKMRVRRKIDELIRFMI